MAVFIGMDLTFLLDHPMTSSCVAPPINLSRKLTITSQRSSTNIWSTSGFLRSPIVPPGLNNVASRFSLLPSFDITSIIQHKAPFLKTCLTTLTCISLTLKIFIRFLNSSATFEEQSLKALAFPLILTPMTSLSLFIQGSIVHGLGSSKLNSSSLLPEAANVSFGTQFFGDKLSLAHFGETLVLDFTLASRFIPAPFTNGILVCLFPLWRLRNFKFFALKSQSSHSKLDL